MIVLFLDFVFPLSRLLRNEKKNWLQYSNYLNWKLLTFPKFLIVLTESSRKQKWVRKRIVLEKTRTINVDQLYCAIKTFQIIQCCWKLKRALDLGLLHLKSLKKNLSEILNLILMSRTTFKLFYPSKKLDNFGGHLISEEDNSFWVPPYWNITKETFSLGRTEL